MASTHANAAANNGSSGMLRSSDHNNGQGDIHKLITVPNGSQNISEYFTNPATMSTSSSDLLLDAAAASSAKIYDTGCKFKKIVTSTKSASSSAFATFWPKFMKWLKISLVITALMIIILTLILGIESHFNCRSLTFYKTEVQYTTWFGLHNKYHLVLRNDHDEQHFPGLACFAGKDYGFIFNTSDGIIGGFKSFVAELNALCAKSWNTVWFSEDCEDLQNI